MIKWLFLSLLFLFSLACGGGGGQESKPSSNQDSQSNSATIVDQEKETLKDDITQKPEEDSKENEIETHSSDPKPKESQTPVEEEPIPEPESPIEEDPTPEPEPPVEENPIPAPEPPVEEDPTPEPEPPVEEDPAPEPEPPIEEEPEPELPVIPELNRNNTSIQTLEDTVFIENLFNLFDSNIEKSTFILTELSANSGEVTFSSNGDFEYQPAENENGTVILNYVVTHPNKTFNAQVDLTVIAVDDEPIWLTHNHFSLEAGTIFFLTDQQLAASDVDNGNHVIYYTLTANPQLGVLKRSGIDLSVGQSFSNSDVLNNKITYFQNNGDGGNDHLSLALSNQENNINGEVKDIVITIQWPENPAPDPNSPIAKDMSNDTTNFLINQYTLGKAAGNEDDFYYNADNEHILIDISLHPQVERVMSLPSYTTHTVVGINESTGINGLYSNVSWLFMDNQNKADQAYSWVTSNQFKWYPSVRTFDVNEPDHDDMMRANFFYLGTSVGKSGSERDEMMKLYYTLAAFKPEVKTVLKAEGLLMPTYQMISRRARVDSNEEYLTGKAHPVAFADRDNSLAMVTLANQINLDDIPPMIQMEVIDETFQKSINSHFSESFTTEYLFTTKASIARSYRSEAQEKMMIVDLSESYDVNSRPLSYHFVVLQGDPDLIEIKLLNNEGSRAKITFKYHQRYFADHTQRHSNRVEVGAFVHNGAYYSPPGFITSLSINKQLRKVDMQESKLSIEYINNATRAALYGLSADSFNETADLSKSKSWDKDEFYLNYSGHPIYFHRSEVKYHFLISDQRYLVKSFDNDGRPNLVREQFLSGDPVGFRDMDENAADYQYNHLKIETSKNTKWTKSFSNDSQLSIITHPQYGRVEIVNEQIEYTPFHDYQGYDHFTIRLNPLSDRYLLSYEVWIGEIDQTTPSSPNLVHVKSIGATALKLVWEESQDDTVIDHYEIYRNGTKIAKCRSGNTFIDSNLELVTSYAYYLRAVDFKRSR